MEKRRAILYFSLLLLVFVFVLWLFLPLLRKPQYKTYLVQKKTFELKILGNGKIEKAPPVLVYFQKEGKISKIFFKEGDKVKFNETLAELENQKLQKDLGEKRIILLKRKNQLQEKFQHYPNEYLKTVQAQIDLLRDQKNNLFNETVSSFSQISQQLSNLQRNLQNFYPSSLNTTSSEPVFFNQQKAMIETKIKEFNNLKATLTPENFLEKLEQAKTILNSIFSSLTQVFQMVLALEEDKKILTSSESMMLRSAISDFQKSWLQIWVLESKNKAINNSLQFYQKEREKLISQIEKREIEKLEKEIENLEKETQQLQQEYERTILKSPTDGEIKRILKKEGEVIKDFQREPVFEILPKIEYQVIGKVDSRNLPYLRVGQEVEISFEKEEEVFGGIITSIENDVLKIQPRKLPTQVGEGANCKISIFVQKKENVILIPIRAVFQKKGKHFVEVLEGKTKKKREVEIGAVSEDMVEIIKGLKESEIIIVP